MEMNETDLHVDMNETNSTPFMVMNETTSISFLEHDFYVLAIVTAYSLFSVFGFFFNLGTAIVVAKYRRPLTKHHVLVLQMLAMNTATSAFCLPMYAYTLYQRELTFSRQLCVFDGFFRYFTTCNYLMTLLLICLHRYFCVVFPGSKWLTFGGARRTALIVFSTSMFVFVILFQAVLEFWGAYGYRHKIGVCSILTTAEGGSNSFLLFGFITATAIPLVAILICYSHICHVLRKQKAALEAAANQDPASQRTLRAKKSRQSQDRSVTVTLIIISFLYIVCNVPLALGVVVEVLDTDIYFKTFATAIFMAHVVSDPLIYALRERKIREIFSAALDSIGTSGKRGGLSSSADYSMASDARL